MRGLLLVCVGLLLSSPIQAGPVSNSVRVRAAFRILDFQDQPDEGPVVTELPPTEITLTPVGGGSRVRIDLLLRLDGKYAELYGATYEVSPAEREGYFRLKSAIFQAVGPLGALARRGYPVTVPVGGLEMPAELRSDLLVVEIIPGWSRPPRARLLVYAEFVGKGMHPAYGGLDDDAVNDGLYVPVLDVRARAECPRKLLP